MRTGVVDCRSATDNRTQNLDDTKKAQNVAIQPPAPRPDRQTQALQPRRLQSLPRSCLARRPTADQRLQHRRLLHIPRRRHHDAVRHDEIHGLRLRGGHGQHARQPGSAEMVEDDRRHARDACEWEFGLDGPGGMVEAFGGGVPG